MSQELREAFLKAKKEGRAALVTFVTAGYPTIEDTVPILKGFQAGGVDIIELGVPFSDPIGDGPTIQVSNTAALKNGMSVKKTLELVTKARAAGVTVPIILMGYYNPILIYGEKEMVNDTKKAGANGFIVVDLPPEEAVRFRDVCATEGLSYVPLVAPSTTDDRLKVMGEVADSFIYVVSRMGVTGAGTAVSKDAGPLCEHVRKVTGGHTPLAVGFGVSTREHYLQVAKDADGVVIGSQIVNVVSAAPAGQREAAAKKYVESILVGAGNNVVPDDDITLEPIGVVDHPDFKESHIHNPRFGNYGGQYVPEALHSCLSELEDAFEDAIADPEFWKELHSLDSYVGRPSSLHPADRLTEYGGGARIWLKREDLNHTGSHKINNALAQVIIARRLGKTNIIAETGAGQHGVATATAAAKFGLGCTVFMGAEDVDRQALNVFRMRILGAKVVAVTNGTQTLRDATSEAFRYWVSHVKDTHYVVGSAIGPHPYPTMVRTFQSVIGREIKQQFAEQNDGKLPDLVVACVGGGSNSTGTFSPFENDTEVKLMGCEAGGEGIETGNHSATLTAGKPGVFHGVKTYVLENEDGQIHDTYSVSAGLDYPGVGPELASWKDSGRVKFIAVTDAQALEGFRLLSQYEGIIPALESSHAVYGALQEAKKMGKDKNIVITVSGRGDKDVRSVAKVLNTLGPKIGWDLRFGSLDDASK